MKIIIASKNKHKLLEFKRILKDFNFDVVSQQQANIDCHAEETGKSFEENAYLKAKTIADISSDIVIADDSGICIDEFNGGPGIYSSRFLGEDTPYNIKNDIILDKMKNIPDEKRGAKYVCAISCIFPNKDVINLQCECRGKIGYSQIGNNGFGYDPIFMVDGKSFAQISDEEKDEISHRGKALRLFLDKFSEYFNKEGIIDVNE